MAELPESRRRARGRPDARFRRCDYGRCPDESGYVTGNSSRRTATIFAFGSRMTSDREVQLEGRSTGLQWFLSFYLVFLVERADAHDDAILSDEPGLSLHPLAQRDLSEFFEGLAKDNQLLYTCHSPFLVDADRLNRARKVYVDAAGTSKVGST